MGNTTHTEQEHAELLRRDWLPFSVRQAIAKKHGMTVTKEFNALVRDVIQEIEARRVTKPADVLVFETAAAARDFLGTPSEPADFFAAAPQPPEALQSNLVELHQIKEAAKARQLRAYQEAENTSAVIDALEQLAVQNLCLENLAAPMVPERATPEMIEAAESVEDLYKRGTPDTWGKVWRVMLAAAQAKQGGVTHG